MGTTCYLFSAVVAFIKILVFSLKTVAIKSSMSFEELYYLMSVSYSQLLSLKRQLWRSSGNLENCIPLHTIVMSLLRWSLGCVENCEYLHFENIFSVHNPSSLHFFTCATFRRVCKNICEKYLIFLWSTWLCSTPNGPAISQVLPLHLALLVLWSWKWGRVIFVPLSPCNPSHNQPPN